ncbi:hypothetical protein [Desulfonatronospira sp.]|uniref:hypothetical protein n=1 Tax=Desulfonatronospira sp. TaxID=1962951 RepID=UPI0025C72BE4|nr:hypothetical protein [Desulfonatronospira sp.]
MSQEKIKPVGEEQGNNPSFTPDEVSNVKQDMGKIALVVAVLAVFLLIIFYYTVNSKVQEFSQKVDLIEEARTMVEDVEDKMASDMSSLKSDMRQITQQTEGIADNLDKAEKQIAKLDENMAKMDERIAEIEDLPDVVRNMVLGGMLEEISKKAEYVGSQVSEEQKEKLEEARRIMNEVREGMH